MVLRRLPPNAAVIHKRVGILGRVLPQKRKERLSGLTLVDFDLREPVLCSNANLRYVAERYEDAVRWLDAGHRL